MTATVQTPEHPAKFSRKILDRLREMLAVEAVRVGQLKVLDPFAGVGGVHELAEETVQTIGYELQPEWAATHADTVCGSVLELESVFPPGTFDVILTSPSYGNRMADSHDAKDPCKDCAGTGLRERPGVPGEIAYGDGSGQFYEPCPACGGSRLSKRNTYTHYLRAAGAEPVTEDNSALMQWGPTYRSFHEKAWRVCDRVLRRDGLVLLNVKNHERRNAVARVVEFHLNIFLMLGYTLEEARKIPTRGLAFGQNHKARTGFELILALRAPT